MDKPSMFEQARSLVAGAKIIIDSDGIKDGDRVLKPTSPVILSCAFSIEVSLKLLLHETGNPASGHDLEGLFLNLPNGIKKAVKQHFNAQHGSHPDTYLEGELKMHKDIFVSWRYAFESAQELECSPSFLYSLAYSLSTYIEKNYEFERNDNGWMVVQS